MLNGCAAARGGVAGGPVGLGIGSLVRFEAWHPAADAWVRYRAFLLGRDYVWPPDELDRVLELARTGPSEARQLDVVGEISEFAAVIEREIVSPESRIDSVRSSSHRRAWMALACTSALAGFRSVFTRRR